LLAALVDVVETLVCVTLAYSDQSACLFVRASIAMMVLSLRTPLREKAPKYRAAEAAPDIGLGRHPGC
jgi:hypothetical protein